MTLLATNLGKKQGRKWVIRNLNLKVENGDVTVVIDPLSLQYLDSAEIDYSADNFSSQFVIRNPNVQATCGCGSSFAV